MGYCHNLKKMYLKNFCIIVSVNKCTCMTFCGEHWLAWWWSCSSFSRSSGVSPPQNPVVPALFQMTTLDIWLLLLLLSLYFPLLFDSLVQDKMQQKNYWQHWMQNYKLLIFEEKKDYVIIWKIFHFDISLTLLKGL